MALAGDVASRCLCRSISFFCYKLDMYRTTACVIYGGSLDSLLQDNFFYCLCLSLNLINDRVCNYVMDTVCNYVLIVMYWLDIWI